MNKMKGKLAIISDLHVDVNQLDEKNLQQLLEVLQEQKVTQLHFAGDVANRVADVLEVVAFFHQVIPTTFHWGNHEMADINVHNDFENFNHPQFLNQKMKKLSEKTVLVGVNGWYDYRFSDSEEISEIKRLKRLYWYDRMIQREGDDPEISRAVNQRLRQTLASIPAEKEIIISTHFVPRKEFIIQHTGKYARWNRLNAFLGSEELGEILLDYPNIKHIVFGHTHHRFSPKKIANRFFYCQPFGYYYEWQLTRDYWVGKKGATSFSPMAARGKVNREADFLLYKERDLKAEFLRGMTLLSY